MNAIRRWIVPALALSALGGISSAAPPAEPLFDPPVRLKAGDKYVDTGANVAHTGPLLHDYDGDGKIDLLVGNFRGTVQLFRNVGTREAPVYEPKGLLQADGKDVTIPNW
jgi:hypothetical protein